MCVSFIFSFPKKLLSYCHFVIVIVFLNQQTLQSEHDEYICISYTIQMHTRNRWLRRAAQLSVYGIA